MRNLHVHLRQNLNQALLRVVREIARCALSLNPLFQHNVIIKARTAQRHARRRLQVDGRFCVLPPLFSLTLHHGRNGVEVVVGTIALHVLILRVRNGVMRYGCDTIQLGVDSGQALVELLLRIVPNAADEE